jgi:hypothetical protein
MRHCSQSKVLPEQGASRHGIPKQCISNVEVNLMWAGAPEEGHSVESGVRCDRTTSEMRGPSSKIRIE